MFAAHTQLARLIAFTDYNKLELDGYLKDQNDIEPLKEKWAAFGWNALEVDGSDISSVVNAVFAAKESRKKPTMIILHTVKGKGVSFIEADPLNNHHMTLGHDEMNRALEELDRIKEED